MLGDRLVRRKKRSASKADAFLAELATLTPGDLRRPHAITASAATKAWSPSRSAASPHDCVALSYAGGDKLYVPVENIDVLSRYGSEAEGVALDRLGGVAWQPRRGRMKDRIREIARRTAQDRRRTRPARSRTALMSTPMATPPSPTDSPMSKPTISSAPSTMCWTISPRGKPMDRLVCGDVGFGKTEVALRAAYRRRHGRACRSPSSARPPCSPASISPISPNASPASRSKVGRLSRLVTANDAKATREGLADGTVDIVVGTHAILAKSVEFKRLGLVIVDEEQRFGVTHKERLKALKADVHVLTLTATPIPRTLQMAMTGLREMSIIQTPPVDRLAVRTYVMPLDEVVMREALLREHYRGGQSFFVVPRIADLADIEEFLRTEVPEVKPVTAHGQMAPSEVEERMSAFYDKRYDVLLSTTIVESGLDIPSANTLIIHRADRFGLAQLYQLRGRVGRAKTRAYAYLTTPADQSITEGAEKRLQGARRLSTRLGAGFQLASHDLDHARRRQPARRRTIRPYQGDRLRTLPVDARRRDPRGPGRRKAASSRPPKPFSPQITVEAPILIPEDYVPDLNVRMALYRRLNELQDRAEIEGFAAEMIDRFGPLPVEAANLLSIIEIKLACLAAGVAKIEAGAKGGLVTFQNDKFANPEGLMAFLDRLGARAKIRPDQKVFIAADWASDGARAEGSPPTRHHPRQTRRRRDGETGGAQGRASGQTAPAAPERVQGEGEGAVGAEEGPPAAGALGPRPRYLRLTRRRLTHGRPSCLARTRFSASLTFLATTRQRFAITMLVAIKIKTGKIK